MLRGINVGGNNLIRMPALKACFEAQRPTNLPIIRRFQAFLFLAGLTENRSVDSLILSLATNLRSLAILPELRLAGHNS